ncbi:haloacid dehalogenase-like hydrolase [Trypanosoma rangeli]|uniref:Haloacid dehalogenase-like hydrolase n=1 Tax=Trypanosoma rangeli TaxID=5698 RepID=A0A422MX56_TRYRA|nr:haloacid dehalogenase-like hydrolase [Trypanosoma rangeli]RNE97787.1 haloacid dehalogenase-like hydrolase [Trypanosoma rangeli]|eukprot:RNE97787.1 haloacid dehalogenase-like hydrolase [Trypanosoma rangeli]
MSFRAVITDLDGTLFNENHEVSQYTAETLKLLRDKGIPVVFATGRPHPDVLHTIDSCGLEGGYLITSNGARVFDPERHVIASHDVDPDVVAELVTIKLDDEDEDAEEPLFTVNLYQHEEWVTNHGLERMLAAYPKSGFRYKEDDLTKRPLDGVHAVFYVGKEEVLLRLEKILEKRFEGRVEHNLSLHFILDAVRPGVNKGRALCEVAQLMGLSENDFIAFGDGMNDRKMLQQAGKGCLVANAHPRLKEALPQLEVIGTNREDGVAKKLREVFGL